jgi:Cu(I)/Ag(I) efflux system membrane fusion protein
MNDPSIDAIPEGEEAPPRGVRTMAAIRWVILGLVVTAALYTVGRGLLPGGPTATEQGHATVSEAQHAKYHCPMHPQIVSDQPGQCPICQMSLVPMSPTTAAKAETGPVADLAAVDAPVDRLQAMGVRVEAAARGRLGETLRTVGRVTADEARLARIHVRFSGYVEKLFVAEQGARVRKGEPLVAVQSDEVLRLEEELLQARKWGGDLAERARERLRLLGVATEEIGGVELRGKADRTVLVRSPVSGYVVGLNVIAGDRVAPDRELFEVADLSRVWVLADVYERELARVKPGLEARLMLDAYPGKAFAGRIEYVYPRLDSQTRTLPVRIALRNPDGKLKPGLFGSVEIQLPPSDGLAVPSEAVIDTGEQRYVFVETSPGHFEPRIVTTGERTGDHLQILSGLVQGERVASGGNFFIDSESRLRASIAQTPAAQPPTEGRKP